jgi:CRP-like cAMP-binding protein
LAILFFNEDELSKGLYIISEGEFEIVKTITIVDEPYDPRFGLISKIPKKSETMRVFKLGVGDSFGISE